MNININVRDIAERVVTTFVLTFLGVIVVAGKVDLTVANVAFIGAVAAVLALVKNLITTIADASNGTTWWQDALLRTMGTYVQVWIGLVLVTQADGTNTLDLTQLQPALVAAIPAALGVLKGLVASHFGDPTTAGFFSTSDTGDHELPDAA